LQLSNCGNSASPIGFEDIAYRQSPSKAGKKTYFCGWNVAAWQENILLFILDREKNKSIIISSNLEDAFYEIIFAGCEQFPAKIVLLFYRGLCYT
jgi:hypothetical protein